MLVQSYKGTPRKTEKEKKNPKKNGEKEKHATFYYEK
tara:strand:- start:1976 stop:2086 length:111 start_codon:yes stop_codon:yes gene_type:complete